MIRNAKTDKLLKVEGARNVMAASGKSQTVKQLGIEIIIEEEYMSTFMNMEV